MGFLGVFKAWLKSFSIVSTANIYDKITESMVSARLYSAGYFTARFSHKNLWYQKEAFLKIQKKINKKKWLWNFLD